jgi:D-alanyl-D-alanine dipeptidase
LPPCPFEVGATGTLPPTFVLLRDIDPTIVQDIRYADNRNFIGRPLAGYHAAECILERHTALALRAVQERIKPRFSLKVFDCYRPKSAVRDLLEWAKDPTDARMKPEFYPSIDKSQLFVRGFIATRSKHSQGTAVDVTLIDNTIAMQSPSSTARGHCAGSFGDRFPDSNLDFGTNFDCFDERSATHSRRITQEASSNRQILLRQMEKAGFKNYTKEWWHFEWPAGERDEFDFPIGARQRSAVGPAASAPEDSRMNPFDTCGTRAAVRIVCRGTADSVAIHAGPSSTSPPLGRLRPADGTVNCLRCSGRMPLSTFARLDALAKSYENAPWCEIGRDSHPLGWLDARYLAPIDQADVQCAEPIP